MLFGPLFTAQSAEPWHAQGFSLDLQLDEPTIPAWQVVQMASGNNQSGWMELERYLHNAKQSGRPPSPVAESDVMGRYAQARGEGPARVEAQARAEARVRERSMTVRPAPLEQGVGGITPTVRMGRTLPTAVGGQPWTSTPANVTAVV